ncbi:hypothetical protein CJ030_MR4G029058 [Morella rubra]|uniref:Uncharacterized protein n=1 Tax=Morella rubra TaxID=262757 RepID=A0A6A1VTZ9_9ROSI|nr:hypothetical protein CJ030_MR4G029058 [Morella rubra]
MDSAVSAKVQHVNKKSSDELLRKFAEMGSGSAKAPARKELRVSKRRKMSRAMEEGEQCESPSSLLERRSLLPLGATRRSALLRQLGIGRSRLSARDIKSRSFLGTIEKTWHKTVEGASKVFMEKHYHRHKRLINYDIV